MFIVLKFFLYDCVKLFEGFYSPCCEKHFCLNCLYFGQDLLDWHDKLLYRDYEIVIQIMSNWQIEPVMNGEIHVHWDIVCIELWAMNYAITQLEDLWRTTSFCATSIMMGSTVGIRQSNHFEAWRVKMILKTIK